MELLETLNWVIPSLPLSDSLEDISRQCCNQIEDYLGVVLTADENVSPQWASRQQLAKTVLAAVIDLQTGISTANKEKTQKIQTLHPDLRRLLSGVNAYATGGLLHFVSKHVLGLYDQKIFTASAPQLLLVPENIMAAAVKLDVDVEPFFKWVLLHETVHATQYQLAPWLREEIQTRVIAISNTKAREQRRQALGELTALMSVIEGQAEHMMDAAAQPLLTADQVIHLRRQRTTVAENQHWLLKLLNPTRAKLKQYQQGKTFCDHLAAADDGAENLLKLLSAPEALPSPEELEHPKLWLQRL